MNQIAEIKTTTLLGSALGGPFLKLKQLKWFVGQRPTPGADWAARC